MINSGWFEVAKTLRIVDVAHALGLATGPRLIARCPECGAEREASGGRLPRQGGSGCGVHQSGRAARCFKCDATFDQIDLVGLTLCARRFRDLDPDRRAEVRVWFLAQSGGAPTAAPRSGGSSSTVRTTPFALAAAESAPPYPELAEVKALWQSLARPDEERVVADYLRSRALDPTRIADRRLAGAVNIRTRLAPWARIGSRSWLASGHRIVALAFDCRGVARSMIARRISREDPKSIAPKERRRTALVLADEIGKRMLKFGTHPSQWPHEPQPGVPFDDAAPRWPADEPLRVVIAEGEIDWLSWTTQFGDASECPPAVLGVIQGSWGSEHAARIPDGARVTIATHHDPAGEKYASKIIETLTGRHLSVVRWNPASERRAGT